jgi:hypothetical protein
VAPEGFRLSDCILPVTRATLSFLAYEIELAVEEHGRLTGGVIAVFMVFIAIAVALVPALGFDIFILPVCLVGRLLFGLFINSSANTD